MIVFAISYILADVFLQKYNFLPNSVKRSDALEFLGIYRYGEEDMWGFHENTNKEMESEELLKDEAVVDGGEA